MGANEGYDRNLFKIRNGVLTAYLAKDAEIGCVYIPSDVVSIGDGAFQSSNIKKVRFLGDTVSIGSLAFAHCDNLESIEFPGSLREIGERAFLGCKKLSKIRIPGGVKELKPRTFMFCGDIHEIELSEGVEAIDRAVFAFSRPGKLILPKSLKRIAPDAFFTARGPLELVLADGNGAFMAADGCLYTRDGKTLLLVPRSVEEANVLEGVRTIGEYALYMCGGLVSVRLPRTLTSIDRAAFSGCAALSSVNIPDGVTYIGESAFSECSSLESVSIPDGVTKIEDHTFAYCERLAFAHLPRGLKSIGDAAFTDCHALTSVTIPAGAETIGQKVFASCGALKEVEFQDPVGWTYASADGGRADADPDILRNPKKARQYLRAKWKFGMSKKKGSRAGADSGWRRLK